MFVKRLIDLLGSLIGMIIVSPIVIIIALSVKLTSKGPVFFKQERLGKNGKVFKIIKFRTMVINAEKMGHGLKVKNESDERITRVGKLLRASSLDELPQLWNVLMGDMSLVGPRPPVPYHPYKYEEYNSFQCKRFEMRPGITGLAQVTVRNSVSWDERIKIDVEYIERFNLWLDIKILFRTLMKVFLRENIYLKNNNRSIVGSSKEIKL